jgi:hypothetical protein
MSTLKEILTRRPVAATIRLTVPAGGARPAPPVGPALGQYRLNLMAFCKDFNARTQKYKPDTPIAVTITAFKDNTFEFTVKSVRLLENIFPTYKEIYQIDIIYLLLIVIRFDGNQINQI